MNHRIIQYYQGTLSDKETEALLTEAETDARLKEDLMQVLNVSALCALHPMQIDREAGMQRLRTWKHALRRKRLLTQAVTLLKYAAVLVVGIMLATPVSNYYSKSEPRIAMQQLTVPAGHRAQITLPDGTKAWVNAGSELRYPSVFGAERRVQLRGEAFFEVAKDKEHDFVVSVGNTCVKALGTKFNVFGYDSQPLQVSLLEGAVRVYHATREADGVVLHPNEQLTWADSRFTVSPMDNDAGSWQHGLFVFRSATMGDIIRRLQLYYGVQITVHSPALLRCVYSGKFRSEDGVEEILRLMSKAHPFGIRNHRDRKLIELYSSSNERENNQQKSTN